MINPNEMIDKTVVNVVQMYCPFISIQTEEVLAEMQGLFLMLFQYDQINALFEVACKRSPIEPPH